MLHHPLISYSFWMFRWNFSSCFLKPTHNREWKKSGLIFPSFCRIFSEENIRRIRGEIRGYHIENRGALAEQIMHWQAHVGVITLSATRAGSSWMGQAADPSSIGKPHHTSRQCNVDLRVQELRVQWKQWITNGERSSYYKNGNCSDQGHCLYKE